MSDVREAELLRVIDEQRRRLEEKDREIKLLSVCAQNHPPICT